MGALENARDRARLLSTTQTVDRSLVVPVTLVSVADDGLSAIVQDVGGAQVSVPCNPAAVWDGVRIAMVLRDQWEGRIVFCLAPASVPAAAPAPAPAPTPTPSVVRRSATITPVSSGSYWRGSWGQLNANRYGGPSDLYQHGEGVGLGPTRGAAFYGARVRALGASSIVSATVHLMGNGSNRGSWTPVLQATVQDSQPGGDVSLTGGTSAGSITGTSETDVDVTGAVDLMRTGAAGGLALVGGTYGALYGTSRGTGMALSVTYEVVA